MRFAQIDPAISSWVKRHKLNLDTEYRDEEVRSVALVDNKGNRFQIWVEELPDGRFRAVGWDHGRRRYECDAEADKFDDALERTLAVVRTWLS